MNFKVLGTGGYAPAQVVTNDDLSRIVETSDEWIRQRVGVCERRLSADETAGDLGYHAALRALEQSGVAPEELDLIVAATVSADTACPTVAGYVQYKLGASCPAFDVNSACSGFLFALDVAAGYFARGHVKKALVLGAERMSRIIDWSDRNTCVIFGDGAGAFVLGEGESYLASKLSTWGGDDVIEIPNRVGCSPFYKGEAKRPYVFMRGQETFRFAVNAMTEDVRQVAAEAGLALEELTHVVPHQANIRIIQMAAKKLGIPLERFFVNIDQYGNTSAASVPMAVDELNRQGGLTRGDTMVLAAFGGGLSSAACALRW